MLRSTFSLFLTFGLLAYWSLAIGLGARLFHLEFLLRNRCEITRCARKSQKIKNEPIFTEVAKKSSTQPFNRFNRNLYAAGVGNRRKGRALADIRDGERGERRFGR